MYNPATGTFTATGSMTAAREGAPATLLQNSEVLVARGGNSTGLLSSAELYNPATGRWTPTGGMNGATAGFHTVLLLNGEVLALCVGGTTDLYNPTTGSWSLSGRFGDIGQFAVTLLGTGEVLVAGGLAYAPRPTHSVASATLYDPATGTWQGTGAMTTARSEAFGDAAPKRVGADGRRRQGNREAGQPSGPLTSAELYQP